MKTSPYSPDSFMENLYEKVYTSPYEKAESNDEISEISNEIRNKVKEIFPIENIPDKADKLTLIPAGKEIDFPKYTMRKYSVEICKNLTSLVYILTPKNIRKPAPGVVALCGHGYGVRHILKISKRGRKKHLNYIDNYQKNFACELAERGCVVIAPELFGFGEARLKKDLIKPFYISSCEQLSHHLIPYGLTTATMRIYQALVCGKILSETENVDAEKISCMGISGGGLTALYASVLDKRFKKVVISGYVNSFRESIFARWHCPDNYIPSIIRTGEIYDFASSLAPRKLLIESGTKDKLFPIEASKNAHERIKKIYSLAGAEGNLIIDVFDGKHSVSGRKSFDFLSE